MPNGIKKQYTGGVIDDSLRDRTKAKISALNGSEDLENCIAKALGDYRFRRQTRETEPAHAEIIKHLKDTVSLIEKLREKIDLMPPVVNSIFWETLYRSKGVESTWLPENLEENLITYQVLCEKVARENRNNGGKRGEKTKDLEHGLLSDIAFMIEKIDGIGLEKAADYAAEILISEGVQNIPNWEKKRGSAAREKVNDYRKRHHPKNEP